MQFSRIRLSHEFSALEGLDNDTMKAEAQQLGLHPRLVTKCCEEFLRHIESKMMIKVYNYQGEFFVMSEMDRESLNNREEVAQAITSCGSYLFQPEICTKEGYNQLKANVSAPNYSKLSGLEPFNAMGHYLTALVYQAVNENKYPSKQIIDGVIAHFNTLKKYFEDCNTSMNLYEARDRAHTALQNAQKELKKCSDESASRKAERINDRNKIYNEYTDIDIAIQNASTNTVKSHLRALRKETQARLDIAANNLQTTETEGRKKIDALQQNVDELQKGYKEASNKAKDALVSDGKATRVSEELIGHIQILADNLPLLFFCLEDYLAYAKGRIDREIPPQSRGWFGLW